jgi:hypothetical protein
MGTRAGLRQTSALGFRTHRATGVVACKTWAVRVVLRLTVVLTALWGVGKLLAGRLTEGDEASDELSIATVFGGLERTSRATSLRHGSVLVCCGGVQLDLREATLDPAGCRLVVRALMGGVQVVVPAAWRVIVDAETQLGGVDARVTPAETLPEDAPTLHVEVVARMGGVALRSDDGAETASDPATT